MTNNKSKILYVDDIHANLTAFKYSFIKYYNVILAESGSEALEIINNDSEIKVVVSDHKMPKMTGIELLEILRLQHPNIVAILLTAYVDANVIAKSINTAKVFGYIQKPFQVQEVHSLIDSAVEVYDLRAENEALINRLENQNKELKDSARNLASEIEVRKKAEGKLKITVSELEELKSILEVENKILQSNAKDTKQFNQIITKGVNYNKVLEDIKAVAEKNTTVMIYGETGTGKELIANAIHNLSSRSNKPLVKINCAALPPSVIESELFGHEKGAFTGANETKIGRFEYADNATLFLDEISELSLELQSKLLRILQEGEFQRIGSNKTIKVDVRIISATNRDLKELCKEQKFREDLYYRLNVFPITSIPLRERVEDIPLLTDHFVTKYCVLHGETIKQVDEKHYQLLKKYKWPGNIRELENIIERSIILSKSSKILLDEKFFIYNDSNDDNLEVDEEMEEDSFDDRERLKKLLDEYFWKIEGAKGLAIHLNIPPSTLRYHIKKYDLKRPPRF